LDEFLSRHVCQPAANESLARAGLVEHSLTFPTPAAS
jgi:hypothetical protein